MSDSASISAESPYADPAQPRPVAVITGAGSGIGRATAILLASRGFDLALVGRREEPLAETADLARAAAADAGTSDARCLLITQDIAEPRSCGAIIERAAGELGRIDVLVNNAGFAPLAPIARTSPELIQQAFATNALAPASLIAAAWKHLSATKRGCIVNISTLGTRDPFQGFFAYAAAKGSVNVMTKSCAIEGRSVGIRAFAVAPGAVETGMLRANFNEKVIPPAAALKPETVASLIVECIEGRRNARNGDTIFITANKGVE